MAPEVKVIVEVIVKVIANADSYNQPYGSRLGIDTVGSDVSDDEALWLAGKGMRWIGNTFHSGSFDLLDFCPAWS
jgi:hypothetical protein